MPDDVAILVPVYDNAGTIEAVLRGCAASGLPVWVVNDGATDGSDAIARALVADGVVREVIDCPRNLGKAGALRVGFEHLHRLGVRTAISVDADGQHDPSVIPATVAIIDRHPDAMVIGCRWPLHPDQPRKNLVGRFFSNLAIRAHCGVAIGDAPCGYRAWPVAAAAGLRGVSGRYAWEQEMITRIAWRGVEVIPIDIPAIYHPRETRVSHYRFRRDWPEGIAIYLWLLLVALVPVPWGGGRGVGRSFVRRFDRLLSPGPLRGRRPETWTNRLLAITTLAVGAIAGITLPASPWTVAAAGWIGWRWHAGLAAIALAIGPSVRATPALAGMEQWLVVAGIAWMLGGVIRPAR